MAFISYAIGIKYMLHQFPAVYVDLDIEKEPSLYFYKHESEFLIQTGGILRNLRNTSSRALRC